MVNPQQSRLLIILPILEFLANVSILYILKTTENLWFSGIFREYTMRILARFGLMILLKTTSYITDKNTITNMCFYRCALVIEVGVTNLKTTRD